MGRVMALSRAVTTVTVTWMSHGSHEPDVDESRLEQAGPWYQCLSSTQTRFALGQYAGSPYLRGTRCGVQNSVAELGTCPSPI